jgi:prepilin-type processing-associated H-X9-DG protein
MFSILACAFGCTFGDFGWIPTIAMVIIVTPLAFVFGIIALNRISKSGGRVTGRGQAIAGLIMGAISFLLYLAMILPAIAGAREENHRVLCMNNMKQIGLAIGMYADAHDRNIPRTFDDLLPYATNLDKLLICPSAKDTRHPSYQILLGGKKWNSDETMDAIIVTEPLSNHRSGRMALYGDGHVSWVSDEAAGK